MNSKYDTPPVDCTKQATLLVLLGVLTVLLAPTGCGEDVPTATSPPAAPSNVSPSRAGSLDSTSAGRGPLVIFLGDSVSAGLGLAGEDSFPAVLERKLDAAGRPIRMVNAGVSGDTTAGGLSRLDWLLGQEPRILVVELGANDALRGQPLDRVEANLRRIIERATQRGCRVLLLGMRVPPSYGRDYAQGFASIYERLAETEHVELVPFFMNGVGGVPELNLPDGIHPTARGHELLAENVFPALRRLVAEVSE